MSASVLDERSTTSTVLRSAVAKIKLNVLPLFILMAMVNYVDRVNISFVRAQLQADVGIGAVAYGLGAGLFFITYALLEVPSNILMEKYGARAWMTRIMITWGIVSSLMAFIHSVNQFYVVRILLGAAEAGFFPGAYYYFTQWFPKEDRGKATALFLSGSALSSMISGPLSGVLLQIEGFGLKGWQWLFLFEGLSAVVLGACVWIWLVSSPDQATWLTTVEKQALNDCIRAEQKEREGAVLTRPSIAQLLRDPQIALFCFLYFCMQVTIYAVMFWLPSVIKSMGHDLSDFQVGALNSVPWICSVVSMYVYAIFASRWKFQQAWIASALIMAALGLYFSTSVVPIVAFLSICVAAVGFKGAQSLFWPIPQQYLDKRIAASVIALINSIGNLGGFVAPATFGVLEQYTGSIKGGVYGLAFASGLSALLVFWARASRK